MRKTHYLLSRIIMEAKLQSKKPAVDPQAIAIDAIWTVR
jgi:hypothetical protein